MARHLRDGLFLSVPRLKMHRFAVMTLAIKNNMGLVVLEGAEPPRSGAGGMHREFGAWLHNCRTRHEDDRDAYRRALDAFAERIVDVLEIALPDATLIDRVPPVAGDGFALIEPLDDGVAIGSTNPVFAEAIAVEYMGYLDNSDLQREIGHGSPPLVEEAARRFWQTTEVLHDITIVGDASFRNHPQVAHYRAMPGFEIGRRPSHREYEFGPRGHFMDIDIDRRRRPRGDVEWSSGMTLRTQVDEEARRFTMEVRIPAAALDREAMGPMDLKLALYRISGPSGAPTHLARLPTYTARPNFHVPARFGWLRLVRR